MKPLSMILRDPDSPGQEAAALALEALAWVLADGTRAQRFLDLTGLTPEALRTSLSQQTTLAAVLDFLAAHEPDLTAAADALGIPPERLAAAREELAA
jgi:hypothetical protein